MFDNLFNKRTNGGINAAGKLKSTEWNNFGAELIAELTRRVITVILNGQSYTPTAGVIDLGTIRSAVDLVLDESSQNAVANSAVAAALNNLADSLTNFVSSVILNDDTVEISSGSLDLGTLIRGVKVNGTTYNTIDANGVVDLGEISGGGSGTQYQLRITNGLDTRSLIVSRGDPCNIKFTFSSQSRESSDDQWQDTGERGWCEIAIRTTGNYATVWSGYISSDIEQTIDISSYLTTTASTVRVTVEGEDSGKTASALTYSVTMTSLNLSISTFDWQTAKTDDFMLPCVIQGNVAKVLHVLVTGDGYSNEQTQPYSASQSSTTPVAFTVTAPENTGVYTLEAWLTNSDGTISTTHQTYSFMYVAAADVSTAKILILNSVASTIKNWAENTAFQYAVYDGTASTTSVIITVRDSGGNIITTSSSESTPTGQKISYVLPLEIETTTDDDFNITVSFTDSESAVLHDPVTFTVDNSEGFAPVSGAVFYLNPRNRYNTDSNYMAVINAVNGDTYLATWSGMSWGSGDGWVTDNAGNKCLRILAGSSVTIPFNPFSTAGGKTLEIKYQINNASDYTNAAVSIVRNLSNGFVGVKITPAEVNTQTQDLHTESAQMIPTDNSCMLHVTIVTAPASYTYIVDNQSYNLNLIFVYVNGVKNRVFAYNDDDDLMINDVSFAGIKIGSQTSDIDVYGVRSYNSALDAKGVHQNYMNWLTSTEARQAERSDNEIYDSLGDSVDFAQMYTIGDGGARQFKYNCFVLDKPFPSYSAKAAVEGVNMEVYFKAGSPHRSYTATNVKSSGQGTSSMYYWEWNIRMDLDKTKSVVTYLDNNTTSTGSVKPFHGVPKLRKMVAKKNWASSMQTHKEGSVNSYTDVWKQMGLSNAATDANSECRISVFQEPFLGWYKSEDEEHNVHYKFMGLFTMGPHKGEDNCFGYDTEDYPNMIAAEGSDNGPLPCLFRVPFDSRYFYWDADEENWMYRISQSDAQKSWEFAVTDNPTTTDIETFRAAYNFTYSCSPWLLPVSSVSVLNADVATYSATGKEYWDSEYNVWYYLQYSGQFVPSTLDDGTTQVNLISQLVDKGYSWTDEEGNTVTLTSALLASATTAEEKNDLFIRARIAKFRAEASSYWNIADAIFNYNFTEFIAATDNRAKNTYPYIFGLLSAGFRFQWRQDDLDTSFPIDNRGRLTKEYWVEYHDVYADTGGAVWNGEDSVFWNLIELAFPNEQYAGMRSMLSAMETLGGGSSGYHSDLIFEWYKKYYTYVIDEFCSMLYNEDASRYEAARIAMLTGEYTNDTNPLSQELGDLRSAEEAWIKKRIIYMMSKYSFGDFSNDASQGMIIVRVASSAASRSLTVNLTPAIKMYPSVGNGTSVVRGNRTEAGAVCPVSITLSGGDQQMKVFAADWYTSIGDWHSYIIDGDLSVSACRLTSLILGNPDASSVNLSITSLSLSNCVSLQSIDLRNITSLAGTINTSGCYRLQSFLAGGTSITGVTLASGSSISTLQLPATVSNITFDSLKNLAYGTSLTFEGLGSVRTLNIQNCAAGLQSMQILADILYAQNQAGIMNLSSVTAVGFNETSSDPLILQTLCLLIDLDATVQIEGSLYVDAAVDGDHVDALAAAFPNLTITAAKINRYVKFEDSRVMEICCYNWGDTVDLQEINGEGGVLANDTMVGNGDTLVYSDYYFACCTEIAKHGDVPAVAARTVQYRIEISVEGGRALDGVHAPWDIATASATTNVIFYPVQHSSAMAAVALGTITAEDWNAGADFWGSQTILTDAGADGTTHKYTALVTTTTAAQYLRLGIRAVAGTNISFRIISVGVTKLPYGITQEQCAAVSSLSNIFNSNTLIKHFKELKYFTKFISVTNNFKNCTNLQSIGFDNVLYNQHLASNSSNSQVLSGCTKLKSIPTYNFIGTRQTSTTYGAMYFYDAYLNALLLPRASGANGNGFANLSSMHGMFVDFGPLIKRASQGNYTTPGTVVLRCPNIVSGNLYNYNIKIYVPSDLLADYKADTNWSKAASRIYAIGGTEWQTLFASTSNPAAEYADIEYYAPELYDEYVEGYEESKATANE